MVDLGALRRNFAGVRRLVGGGVRIWPAVKANAYGHGAVEVVRVLPEADGFCVATVAEAEEIAKLADGRPVLHLGAFHPEDAAGIIAGGFETAVVDVASASLLDGEAGRLGRRVRVHLKVDTGMGRVGMPVADVLAAARSMAAMPGLEIAGLMTHFPTSDDADLTFARAQAAVLPGLRDQLSEAVGRPLLLHAANSGAVLGLPEACFDTVRPGIMLYGAFPSPDAARTASLEPVMTLSARIVFIKTVPPGTTVSYGRTWTARRDSRIATVSIGYGDGLPRALSNRGFALVRGAPAPIAGRICMDAAMLDVTDIPDAACGDDAVFWGRQGDAVLRIEDVAAAIDTIPYELTCGVTARVPRVFV